jgi:hypothetical protein
MNQFATADQAAASAASKSFETAQNAWRRNLEVSAEAARALQAENARFAAQLFDLNLRAARAFGHAGPSKQQPTPFELGASAVELYMDYLGRSAALARQAIALPWTEAQA